MQPPNDGFFLTLFGGAVALLLKALIEALSNRLTAGHKKQLAEIEAETKQQQINQAAQEALTKLGLEEIKEFKQLKTEFHQQTLQIDDLKRHNVEQDIAFQELFTKSGLQQVEISTLKGENAALHKQVAELTERVNTLAMHNTDLQSANKLLRDQLDEARRLLEECENAAKSRI